MVTNKRLINAHDLWSDIMILPHNGDMISSEEVEQAIVEALTVDAVEVVHGRWKRTSMYDEESLVQCSECLMEFDYIDGMCYLVTGSELPFYCPNCGAKMDGGN